MLEEDISFIVPCYKASKTLGACLSTLSVARKFFRSSEVIVVDNDPYENGLRLSLNSDVLYVKEVRKGRSFARNAGARKARGKWLAFVDADVLVDPRWAIELVSMMKRLGCAGGQGQIIPSFEMGHKKLNEFRYESVKKSTNESFLLLQGLSFETPMINSAACIYHSEYFNKVSGFDTALSRHEDIDLSKRIFLHGGDLCACRRASVEVIFHGEGWIDYFKRSFADGRTKMEYFDKWTRIAEQITGQEQIESSFWVKAKITITDAVGLFLDYLKDFKFNKLILFLLFIINHLGKVMGLLANHYKPSTDSMIVMNDIRQQGRVYIEDQSFELDICLTHEEFIERYGWKQRFLC